MSHELTVSVSDAALATLREEAESVGRPVSAVAADVLGRELEKVRRRRVRLKGLDPEAVRAAAARFEAHFGSVNSGNPRSADNDAIDADLARAYANQLPTD